MFSPKQQARVFYEALKEHLAKFGLGLSEEKSRIMRFGRFAKQHSKAGKTENFDFLGVTLINGMTMTGNTGWSTVRARRSYKQRNKR